MYIRFNQITVIFSQICFCGNCPKTTIFKQTLIWLYLLQFILDKNQILVLKRSISGFPQKSEIKIPWLFPDFSLTKFIFSWPFLLLNKKITNVKYKVPTMCCTQNTCNKQYVNVCFKISPPVCVVHFYNLF